MGYTATAIVGGDAKSLAIGAASIVAKHVRDEMMIAAAEDWAGLWLAFEQGYGSATHLAALREHGPTPLHRRSFAPVAPMLSRPLNSGPFPCRGRNFG
ncbi:Ribonuclease HII [Sphingomonas paucimobilis]|nr:Ribonuclease HII [Sphingomonas paucimobilis]